MTPGQQFDLNVLLRPLGFTTDDLYVFLAAIAAFMTVVIVGKTFVIRDTFSSRAKLLQQRRKSLKEEIAAPKRRGQKRAETVNFMRLVVNRFKLLQASQVNELNQLLIAAGIRNKDAVVVFAFFKFVTPFALLLASLFFVDFEEFGIVDLLIVLSAAYIGMKLPNFVINKKRKKRYLMIQRSLADTLDLLMICAEAGLSLAQGLDRVSKELQHAYPEMSDELALTSIELSFQPDRQKTLNNLATRVQLQEVKGIVNVLIQTEKYGTPIAQALRTLSQEFRTQRMLRAEQKAARLPAIMTIPMILFILPTLFIVVIAPAAINLMDAGG